MALEIRHGLAADASNAINVLRRSISELCSADHHDDTQDVAAWLHNKTEAVWQLWIAREDTAVFVAEIADEIVGVGMVDRCGEVLLNYVSPDMRFQGISKAILMSLEQEVRSEGVAICSLESTETARRFYEGCGYTPVQRSRLKLHKML